MRLGFIAGLWVALCLGPVDAGEAGSEPPAPGANPVALEALRRLKGMDLETSPALKSALLRVLDSVRGTGVFVELVRDFHIDGQESGLLEVAVAQAEAEGGVEAIRWLLKSGQEAVVEAAWETGPEPRRAALTRVLARVAEPRAVPLLSRIVCRDESLPADRSAAVRGLVQTEPGAEEVLRLAETGALDEATRTSASLSLAQSRWPGIRERAARVLPPPVTGDGVALPPIDDLVQRTGDAARGAEVFRSVQVGCITCHRVGDEGVDFGPALTGIGVKLGKRALYESILDPSAGIAFGYEGWEVETRDHEEVFGIVASATADELVIRQAGGVLVQLRAAEVARKERQRLSIMPAGLAQLMSTQQLVDLVEYLAGLGKPPDSTAATPGP